MSSSISGPRFRIIDGLAASDVRPEKIAFSVVHPSAHINVPVSAIHWIEACDNICFVVSGVLRTFPDTSVEVNLRADIAVRIHRLTREIVGEFVEIIIDGECISKPHIIGPVAGRFRISMGNIEDAKALAAKMQSRCNLTRPRLIGEQEDKPPFPAEPGPTTQIVR
jgi:hypothetical protein